MSGYIENAGNVSVNGQRETANAFLVNGGDVSEGRNLGAGLVPNLDSVEEFRLITNSFDAEYGKFSGAVMNAITKSGTNGFHGDVFEFLRNDKLDAVSYFFTNKSELRRNQFGTWLSGPAKLPHYQGRDKTFWSFNFEGTRQTQETVAQNNWFPQAFRNGDFSALLNDQHEIAELLDEMQKMRAEDDRCAVVRSTGDRLFHAPDAEGIEAGQRLVEDQNVGRVYESAGDHQFLFHPAGELGRQRFAFVAQLEFIEQRVQSRLIILRTMTARQIDQ